MTVFYPRKNSLIHSFSITENYAIFIFAPVVLESPLCLILHNFHSTECLTVLENELSDIFIVNLKTGKVIEMQGEILFSLHHINAYEKGEEIIIDLTTANEFTMRYSVSFLLTLSYCIFVIDNLVIFYQWRI